MPNDNFDDSNFKNMWTLITDCGKQLTIHSKVREMNEGDIVLYDIIGVESDQYKLKVIERNSVPETQEVRCILNCEQLLRYAFEVWQNK